MLITLARFYCTLSLALPPVALVVLGTLMAEFKENGPQSNGLGTFILIAGTILMVLSVNAVIAGIIAWRWPSVRTTFSRFAWTAAALLGLSVVLYGVLRLL
ncbi:MAG: hypothetical protein K9N47_04320 [Prosthecobacter sp.]|uniref:hypothetical protein n=1 Tax=Prosthecobacter sp. TaxID=1965333 RepID=UPI0025E770BE|nr:hypothetical protein [Prosthecobacter sp.]MCF7785321.1 hypothetical protein [Prosthecobacter sp.]